MPNAAHCFHWVQEALHLEAKLRLHDSVLELNRQRSMKHNASVWCRNHWLQQGSHLETKLLPLTS